MSVMIASVDDPLKVGGGGLQVPHQRRQRDVEDRVVERDEEQRHAQHHECQPWPRRRRLPLAALA
jgi:hypothetical protein